MTVCDDNSREPKDEYTKTNHLTKGTTRVSAMTIVSRVSGFAREMVCASFFGASSSFDAFIVAFKIPNFLRRLFAEGAFAQAFVPILSEYRATRSSGDVKKLLNNVAGMLGVVLLIVSVIGMLAAPLVIRVFAPGFSADGSRLHLAVDLLRITFPYIFFVSLMAFTGSILNSYDRFSMPAFAPVLLNISMIACAVLLATCFSEPVTALAWGVFLGGVTQLGFLMFFAWKIHLLPKPSLSGDEVGVKRILKNMLPAIFGVSVAQINLLFDTVFASFLPLGSISWLYYSDRIMEFPLGVFGVALATVVLPHLSREFAKSNHKEFVHTIDWALQLIILIGLPSALGLFVLAEPLLITLFNYGKFTAIDVYKTALSLQAFACGLLAFVSIKILASANYARKDIKTPVKIAALCMVINVVLSLILMQFFHHVGLALSGAITGIINAALLLRSLIKRNIYQPLLGWKVFISRVLLANFAWVSLVLIFNPSSVTWLQWNALTRGSILLGIISSVMAVYFLVLKAAGLNFKQQLRLD
ncbi:MAG: murein biosynthesis integral membrane protein MurJ [Gammaproteobacteria bacterium]|nr:murein biosynthesis integral membrane protein MurJ [Gammaproteobacteria bacterium]